MCAAAPTPPIMPMNADELGGAAAAAGGALADPGAVWSAAEELPAGCMVMSVWELDLGVWRPATLEVSLYASIGS